MLGWQCCARPELGCWGRLVFFRDIAILQQPLLALPIATSVSLSVYFWLLELSGQYTVYSILSSGVVPAISAWVDTTVDFDGG